MATFGERLKELRQIHSLKQSDISKLLNVKDRIIIYYEKNERVPPLDKLLILADCFGVSLDYLVGRIDIPYTEEQIYMAEESLFEYCKTELKTEYPGFKLIKYVIYKNLPEYYKDSILRKQNYTLETRARILFILKAVLHDYEKDVIQFEDKKNKSESTILDDMEMVVDYYLQKTGFKKPSVLGIDQENNKKKLKLSQELHNLLYDGIERISTTESR